MRRFRLSVILLAALLPAAAHATGWTVNGATITLTGNQAELLTTGDLTISKGSLVAANGAPLFIGGNWDASGGTFTGTASSVTFTGPGTGFSVNPGQSTFYKLVVAGSGDWTTTLKPVTVSSQVIVSGGLFIIGAGATTTVAGTVDVQAGGALQIDADLGINSNNLINQGFITTTAPNATVRLAGTGLLGGDGSTTLPGLTLVGASQTTTLISSVTVMGDLTIPASHTLDVSPSSYELGVGHSLLNSGTLNPRSGTLTLVGASADGLLQTNHNTLNNVSFEGTGGWTAFGGPIDVNGTLDVNSGTFTVVFGSTVTVHGAATVEAGGWLNINGDLSVNGGSLDNNGTVVSLTTTTVNLSGNGSLGGAGTTILPKLVLAGTSMSTTLGGPVTVNGQLTNPVNHTLDANDSGSYDLILSSDFLNSGAFAPQSGTVIFTGTSTLSGSTTFYNFEDTTPGTVLIFPAGVVTTVANNLTLSGAAGNLVILKSTTGGSQAKLNVGAVANFSIASVNVEDNNAVGQALTASASTNGGNTTRWTFGTTKTWVGPGNWSTAANWSPAGVPGESDSVLFSNGNTCTIDISTTVAQFTMQSGYTGTITASQNLTVAGGFLEAGGTFNQGSTTLTVGGNWVLSGGTFNPGTGTTLFNATSSGRTIATNKQSFYNVTFSGLGGYWTMQDSMTVLGNLALNAGTLDTKTGSNFGISVGANWSNNGGAFAPNLGSVTLTGTSAGLSIDPGASSFYKLLTTGSGGWQTANDPVTVSSAVTVNAGTLTVTGTSSMTVVGGIDVKSGATLALNNDASAAALTNAGTVSSSGGTLTLSANGNLGGAGPTRVTNLQLKDPGTTLLSGALTVLSTLTNGIGHTLDVGGSGYAITISSGWSNAGTFNAQSGSVTFNGSASGMAIDPGTSAFYTLAFTGTGRYATANHSVTVSSAVFLNAGAFTVSAGSTLTVAGGVDVKSGATFTLAADALIGGSLTNAGTVTSNSAATLTLNGTGALGGTGNTRLPFLAMTGAAKTTTLNGAITVQSDLSNASGHTFDASASNFGVTLAGSWANAGTYTAHTSSVTFNAPSGSLAIDSGNSPFYKIAFTDAGTWSTTANPLTISSAVFVNAGNFTVAAGSSLTVAGGVDVKVNATLTLNENAAINGGGLTNAGTITSDPATTLTLAGTGVLGGAGATVLPGLTLSGAAQTTTLGAPITIQGNLTNGASHTFDASTNNYSLTVGGGWTNSGTYAAHSSSVTFSGSGAVNIVSGDSPFYNILFNGAGTWTTATNALTILNTAVIANGILTVSGSSLTVAGTMDVQVGGSLTIDANVLVNGGSLTNEGTINADVTTSTLTVVGTGTLGGSGNSTFPKLILTGSGQTTTLGGPITVLEALTNNSGHTLDVSAGNNYQITVSSSWVNAGTFTPESGTVVFTGTGTISGNSTFFNMTAITGGNTMIFIANSTQTVTGALQINGVNGALISLVSSVSGTRFNLRSLGTADLQYLNIKDSLASGNKLNASASTDAGNNLNWTFGTTKTWTGGGSNTSWSTAANWSPSGAPGALDSVIFTTPASRNCVINISTTIAQLTIQGNFPTNRTITANAGIQLTISGDYTQAGGSMTLTSGNMTVGGNWKNTGGIFKPGTATVIFNSNGAQTIRTFGRPFNNVIFNGVGGYWTLQDSMTVLSSMTITAGALDTDPVGNNGIAVGLDWMNGGGAFVGNESTVTFNATTSGRTITSGGSAFGHVLFNGSGATWTLSDAFSAKNLTLTAGALDTYNLGNFPITIAGDALWNGGTLTLNASSVTVMGNWTYAGTTFNLGTSTVAFSGTGTDTLTTGGQAFYNLTFNGPGRWTTLTDPLSVQNAFSVQAGTFTLANATAPSTFAGNVSVAAGGTFLLDADANVTGGNVITMGVMGTDVTTATLALSGAGSLGGSGSTTLPNVSLTGAAQTTTLIGPLTITQTLSVAAGHTLDVATQPLMLTGNGTPLSISGAWTAAGSSVTYAPSGGSVIVASATFGNLQLNGTGATFNLSGPTAAENLSILGGALDVTASNWPLTITNDWSNADTFIAQAGSVTFAGSTSGLTIDPGSSPFYKVAVTGGGGYTSINHPLLVSSSVVLNAGTFTVSAGSTLTVAGSVDIKAAAALALNADAAINGGALTNAGAVIADPSASLTLSGTGLLGGVGTMILPNLTLSGSGKTTTLASNVTLSGALTNNAGHTLDVTASNYGITASSSWVNSGTYVAHAGSVTFNGSTAHLTIDSGNSAFYRLFMDGAGDWTAVNNPVTVSSSVSVAAGNFILASGSSMTVAGNVDIANGASFTMNADVGVNGGSFIGNGNLATSNAPTLTLSGTGFLGGTGSDAWPKVTLSGTGTTTLAGPETFAGVLTINSGHTLDVSPSNYDITLSSGWANSGTFVGRSAQVISVGNVGFSGNTSFNDFTAVTPGITLTFAAGSTQTIAGVFTITGASGNTIKLRSGTLLQPYYIQSNGTAGVSFANVQDSVASGNTLNASASTDAGRNVNWTFGTNYVWVGPGNFSVASNWSPPGNPGPIDSVRFNNANDCTVDISTTITRLTIDNTYSGAITLNQDLTLAGNYSQAGGTFHAGAHTVTVGTSWDITGGHFDAGTSTIAFTAQSAGRTITSDGQPFYNVTLNGTGGYWTLQDSMTVLSSMTLTAGVLDAGTSGGISMGLDWINNGGGFVAGASTVTFVASSGNHSIRSGGVPFNFLALSGAGTWAPTGGPLTTAGNVTLTNGATLTVADPSTATVGGLTLNSGTTFNMNTNMTVNGTLTNNGTFTALSTTTLEMAGVGSMGGTSATRLARMDVASSGQVHLVGPITVAGGLSIQTGGVLDAGTGNYAITVSSAWSNAGTFNAQAGSVTFNGSGAGYGIDPGASSFYKVAFTGSGSWMTENTPVTVSSAVFLNAGQFTVAPGSTLTVVGGIDVKSGATLTLNTDAFAGSLTNAGTVNATATPTLTLNGDGQLGGTGSTHVPSLSLNGAAQTTTLNGPVTVLGNLNNGSAHVLDAGTLNYGLTLAGSWANTGTFVPHTSSVTLNGSATGLTIASGNSPFYNLAFTGTGAWASATTPLTVSSAIVVNAGSFTVAAGSTLTVAGNLTVKSGATATLGADTTVNGGGITNAGTIGADAAATLTLAGTGALGGSGVTVLPSVNLTGAAQTTTLAGPIRLLGDLTNASGHVLDASASSYGLTVGGGWTNSGTFTARTSSVTFNGANPATIAPGVSTFYNLMFNGAGTWTSATNPITVSSSVEVANGNFTVGAGSTLTVAGTVDVQAAGTLTVNANVLINGGGLTNAGTVASLVTTTVTLSGTGTVGGSGTTTLPKLILAGNAQTTTLNGNITVQEALTNNSGHTLDANATGNYQVTASSSWVNAGTFTPRNGTVVLAGNGTFVGQTTFFNVSALTPSITLAFPAGSTQTVTGALILNGTSGGLIALRSTTSGSYFYLNNTGSADILYVDVKDSRASGNTLNASASTNSGHTSNWTFGTSRRWIAGTSTVWSLAANWTPTGVPGALDIVVFDGGAGRNCALDISTSVAQIVIYSTFTHTLSFNAGTALGVNGDLSQKGGTVSFSNPITLTLGGGISLTGGTFTPGTGTVIFNANAPGQLITTSGRPFNNVTFNGTGGYWTLQDSMTVLADLTLIAGALDTNSTKNNAIAVKGNWLNNGGSFVANGSTVTFTGASAELITSNGNAFGSVQFNGAGGSWTPQDTLTANGNVTLAAGTLNGGANAINVSGNWAGAGGTFNAGTSTVTFAGAGGSLSQLTGSTTFYNLQSIVPGKLLQFQATQAQGVNGTLTLTGAPGNRISLRSTSDPITWFLNALGSEDVSYVDVKASNAGGGDTIFAGQTSANSTGNVNWVFDDAPLAVTNFLATPQNDGTVFLTWSAPDDADDNPMSSGSQYVIEWATYSIAGSTSNAGDTGYTATQHIFISTSGATAGDAQIYVSTGLIGNVAYNFRLWTQDSLGLWSGVSNVSTATVTPVLSVSFSANAYAFGTVNLGATTISTSPITVVNHGNVPQTYELSVSTTGPSTVWAVGTGLPNAMDQFALFGTFSATQPNASAFGSEDILISTPTAATGSVFSVGGQTGVSVPQQSSLNLWLRLNMPPSTTTTDQQQMKVNVTATP